MKTSRSKGEPPTEDRNIPVGTYVTEGMKGSARGRGSNQNLTMEASTVWWDRRRSPMMTQVPSFSDAGPSSVDSVHRPSRPSHARNVFHFAKGLWSEEECLFPPSSLLFNLVFVL